MKLLSVFILDIPVGRMSQTFFQLVKNILSLSNTYCKQSKIGQWWRHGYEAGRLIVGSFIELSWTSTLWRYLHQQFSVQNHCDGGVECLFNYEEMKLMNNTTRISNPPTCHPLVLCRTIEAKNDFSWVENHFCEQCCVALSVLPQLEMKASLMLRDEKGEGDPPPWLF